MDRRSFGKLLAGTVTAAGIPQVSAGEQKTPGESKGKASLLTRQSSVTDIPPNGGGDAWELVILDAAPPYETETNSCAAADIDGDGRTEVIIGGNGSLLWYRPSTFEKGVVAQGHFSVGVALLDIDHDGRMEIIVGKEKGVRSSPQDFEKWNLCWYKSGTSLNASWTEHIADDQTAGQPHDAIFSDLDGDGKHELVVNAMYSDTPGLFAYKIPPDPRLPWKKQMIQSGLVAEGTVAGDLDGDGRAEIVSGPYWFSAPPAGAFSGQAWKTHSLAAGFRELCRAAIVDVDGDGRLDVVLVEDEYPDGHLAWFENRIQTDPEHPWIEHPIDAPLIYSHSLRAWRDDKTKQVQVLAGEMNEGGWDASYDWNARLIQYTTVDGGKSWRSNLLYEGEGTHEALRVDLDSSGTHVIFGHAGQVRNDPGHFTGWVQMFRPREKPTVLSQYKHLFIDREKPYTGIDIHAVDVDGDGMLDIVCGAWWYKNPQWERHPIPGVAQIINAYDLDNDGRKELIGIKPKAGADPGNFYSALCSDLVWLKSIDLGKDLWEEHVIGSGDGDWPHGNAIAPLLPGGRVALVCGYHNHAVNPPQIFEVPDDPTQSPWKKSVIADIQYGEEMIAYDLDGDGKLDIVAGPHWLENLGNGRFEEHLLIDPDYLESENLKMISRIAITDVNGDGHPDILFTVEAVDYNVNKAYFRPVGWLENTGSPQDKKFNVHIIDRIRSPHSIGVGDLDGDGELEVIAGEHDPFHPYRSQSRLYAYKKVDSKGIAWSRFPIDNRFEHHDGAKVVELSPGRLAILSHAWHEPTYVHLWDRS